VEPKVIKKGSYSKVSIQDKGAKQLINCTCCPKNNKCIAWHLTPCQKIKIKTHLVHNKKNKKNLENYLAILFLDFSWYFDSMATKHILGNNYLLISLKELNQKNP
jgi:hypothetical protein